MDEERSDPTRVDPVYRHTAEGIHVPPWPVVHREDEYESSGFEVLARMQDNHFWYRGRHRYIYETLRRELANSPRTLRHHLSAIDLGGGCGGWVKYFVSRGAPGFSAVALGDSSRHALEMARSRLGSGVSYYQTDLLHLGWTARWDVAFLLDVLEHLPDDVGALRQVHAALAPGGRLVVTVPALGQFWSYNDDLAHHLRRYSKKDVARLADEAGFRLVRSQYFVFFASPLLYLSRRFAPDVRSMTKDQIRAHIARTHRAPPAPINGLMEMVMTAEEILGRHLTYPFGTSLLGVLTKA